MHDIPSVDHPAAAPFSAAGALALTLALAPLPAQNLPAPEASGIEHIVIVTMENRSFDHMLGWLPHADGRQQGLTYFDRANQTTLGWL